MTRAATRAWRIALLLGAAIQPWCEAGARGHAQARFAARGGFDDWDLDLAGLQLRGVAIEVRGHRLAAEEVAIGLADDGVRIDVLGLAAVPVPSRDAGVPSEEPAAAEPTTPRGDGRIDTHGLAVHVRTHGTIAVDVPSGGALVLADPALDLDPDGTLEVRARGRVDGLELPRLGGVAIATDDLSLVRTGDSWHGRATLTVDGGRPLALAATRDAEQPWRLDVDDDAGGHLELVVADRDHLELRADRFALRGLGPSLLAHALARGIGLADVRLDGALTLVRGDAAPDGDTTAVPAREVVRVHAEQLVVDGLVLDDRRLAARAVRLDAVSIDGDVAVRGSAHIEAQLLLEHRDAQLALGLARHGDALRVDVDLAELGCTELVRALPDGMADVLRGARLRGTIDGRAELEVSFAALARARAEDDSDGEPRPPPGRLAFDFDVLERCHTVAPPAAVDLEGLRGPWRHRFRGDDGRVHERVLAPGAPDFVPLGRVSRIAEAFIALEDMRYWLHDGFDREQIERAFWHNLKNGRVRRGASTISQQTARNLWLGVDRSLSRKLQEAYLTALLESGVSKARILELYVNLVELGPGIYGVDAAARYHFGVPAEELDALQAIHLASLAPAPRTLSERFAGGTVDDAWLAGLRDHARRMHRNGMLTAGELHQALHGDLGLRAR